MTEKAHAGNISYHQARRQRFSVGIFPSGLQLMRLALYVSADIKT